MEVEACTEAYVEVEASTGASMEVTFMEETHCLCVKKIRKFTVKIASVEAYCTLGRSF